jgi:integrase/recombinase XerD
LDKVELKEPARNNAEVLFPNASGGRLSPDSVADLLAKHVVVACQACPSLSKKHVTPHVLRHSMAMDLLQAGVDRAVIALWLGHESVETTQIYLDANLALKEAILEDYAARGKARPLSSRRRTTGVPQNALIQRQDYAGRQGTRVR